MSAIKVGIVAIIVGAIGTVAILVTPSWFPVAAAVQAHRQDDLYLALMIMSSFIMAVVTVFLVYSVWRWRATPDDLRDGPPIHGNTTLEIIWTVVPTIIVIAFAVAGGVVLVKNEQTTNQELVVNVTGEQFEWTFKYPNGVVTHELVLEKGRPDGVRHHLAPARRDPLLLRAPVPGQGRRRAGHHELHLRHADQGRQVRADLHRAVRPRPLADAGAGAGDGAG